MLCVVGISVPFPVESANDGAGRKVDDGSDDDGGAMRVDSCQDLASSAKLKGLHTFCINNLFCLNPPLAVQCGPTQRSSWGYVQVVCFQVQVVSTCCFLCTYYSTDLAVLGSWLGLRVRVQYYH